MLPLDSIAANALGALLAAFCLWLLSFICPPLRRFFLGMLSFFRCAIRCRAIARENAELKAALALKDSQLATLRASVEKTQQAKKADDHRFKSYVIEMLDTIRRNPQPAFIDTRLCPGWAPEFEARILSCAMQKGLLFANPLTHRLTLTDAGIDLLIDTGHIPTPQ